jgi:hypothetical protein
MLWALFRKLLAADPERRVAQQILFEWLTPGAMQMTAGISYGLWRTGIPAGSIVAVMVWWLPASAS